MEAKQLSVAVNNTDNEKETLTPQPPKIPIFIGVNDKDKLNKILEIIKDDDVYEVAILAPQTYQNLIAQYTIGKMNEEKRRQFEESLKEEKVKENLHKLIVELKERGYDIIDRRILKEHFERVRRVKLNNEDVDDVLETLFAVKKVEIVNYEEKPYKREYKLIITDEDMLHANKLLLSAIKEQLEAIKSQYNNQKAVVKKMVEKAKEPKTQNDNASADSNTDSAGINQHTQSKS